MLKTIKASAVITGLLLGVCLNTAQAQPVAASGTQTPQLQMPEFKATQALNRLLTPLQSMQAEFVQTTKNNPARQPKPGQLMRPHAGTQKFSGVMQVKRPGQFRWETRSPMKQLIVTNGKTVWIYDEDLQQATRQQLDAQIANTPALLFSGHPSAIAKSFRVTQPNPTQPYFVLYPRTADGAFDSLAIRFQGNVPAAMELRDSLGQQTTIQFAKVTKNTALPNTNFQFTPPKGTDVIDQ